jgi:hypothetical protein
MLDEELKRRLGIGDRGGSGYHSCSVARRRRSLMGAESFDKEIANR